MSRQRYEHIRANKKFHDLVARKSRMSWGLAGLIMLVYYSFILVIAFFPELLGKALVPGSILTWGLPVGISIILFTFAITGIYVHRANNLYDALMQDVINASQEQAGDRDTHGRGSQS